MTTIEIKSDDEQLAQAAREALTRPEDFDYFGRDDMFETWGMTFSKHRDSEALDRSNWDVIIEALGADEEIDGDTWAVDHFGHWAVGWVERITCQVIDDDGNVTPVFKKLHEFAQRLESYPILDEQALSQLELDEMVEWCETISAHWEDDGIEYEARNPDSWGSDLAAMISEEFSANRADDAPGEDRILEAARDAGLLIPDVEFMRGLVDDLRGERDRLIDMIGDVNRGIRSMDELATLARDLEGE